MADKKKSSDRISPKKLSDLKVVVLCIAAATTFWILNALNKDDYNTVVDFPVEFLYDREEFIPVKKVPKSLQLEISGNGWDLLRKYFNFNTQPYPIPLKNPSSSHYILTSDLKRSLGEFLSPTQLISVLDDSLKYEINKVEMKQIRPELDSTSYTLAKNHRINGKVIFTPKIITVKGPSSILEKLGNTLPVKLDESKIDDDLEKNISLSIPKDYRDLVTIEDPEIKVTFEVIAFLEGNKRLKIKKLNFPNSVTLANEETIIMVSYLVDERKVAQLKDVEFAAILNYDKRNQEDSTIAVQVEPIPSYLEQVKIEPSIVKLKYEQ